MAFIGGATFTDAVIQGKAGTAASGILFHTASGLFTYLWIATDAIPRLGRGMKTTPNGDFTDAECLGVVDSIGFGVTTTTYDKRAESQTTYGSVDFYDTISILHVTANFGFPGVLGFQGTDGKIRYLWATTTGNLMIGSSYADIKANPNATPQLDPTLRWIAGDFYQQSSYADTLPARPQITRLCSPEKNGNIVAMISSVGRPSGLAFTDSLGFIWYVWLTNATQLLKIGTLNDLVNNPENGGFSVGFQE